MKKKLLGLTIVASLAITSMADAGSLFKDIDNHWAKPVIEWGSQNQIIKGYPDGTFKPDQSVNEAEFLTILIGSYKKKENLTSLDSSPWPSGYYDFADNMHYPVLGINKGNSAFIDRQDVANLIAASQGTTYTGTDAIHYLLLKGLAKGKGGSSTIHSFDAKSYLTRAEAVQFVKNAIDNGKPTIQAVPSAPSPALPKVGEYDVIGTANQSTATTDHKPNIDEDKFLQDADPMTQPIIEEFINSVKIKGNTVTGVVPNYPKGYTLNFHFYDTSNGPSKPGNRENNSDLSNLKPGATFSKMFSGQGGFLMFGLFKGYEGVNSVRIDVPSLEVRRGNKR